jgi:hypothetical protein
MIYRIAEEVSVPGKKVVGGEDQPGSVEVAVYADVPGEEYNKGLTDFTIPGFAGSPRFETIYARSKTEISGGFVGLESVIKPEDKERIRVEAENLLKAELISEVNSQVPDGFILFPSLSSTTFEDLPQTSSAGSGKAMVNVRGNLYSVMFKRSDLSAFLAQDQIQLNEGESVDIEGLESLELAFSGVSPSDLLLSDTVTFSVTGVASAVWRTDEIALRADLVGKRKKDVPAILNNYPSIISVTSTISPFWKTSFPSDGSYVYIKKLPIK